MLLGAQLRRLREDLGITRGEAGHLIRASESKISRMELGRVGFKERDVADLLTLYHVTAEEDREPLLVLAREANQPGWWHSFTDVLPDWFEPYLGMEAAATRIRSYEVQLIPGLLQTEDYARTVITGPGAIPAETVDRLVSVRTNRQKILDRPDPPRLWVVLDEAAVRRRIGTPAILRAQLKHLIKLSERPNVVIQVLPSAFGAHIAEGGSFSILRFAEPDLRDVVYVEHFTSAAYLDKPGDVYRYEELMNHLSVDSTHPNNSPSLLAKILSEI
jgi:hypothetical protein